MNLILADAFEPFIQPFRDLFHLLGWCQLANYAAIFAVIFYALVSWLIKLLIGLLKKKHKVFLEIKKAKDIYPSVDDEEVKSYTEAYIRPRFQLSSPTIETSPAEMRKQEQLKFVNPESIVADLGGTHDLIDFFIHRVFSKKEKARKEKKTPKAKKQRIFFERLFKSQIRTLADRRFFFVLGDTGMGKTAFMINLLVTYRRQWSKKFEIELFLLNDDNVDKKIMEVQNKKNVILLLDGLDEDLKAAENVKQRIDELADLTRDFRKIIFSCRTQFFTHEREEPKETEIKKAGETKVHYFSRLYLAPLAMGDIRAFIDKRYKQNPNRRDLALATFRNIPDITIRPMILKFLDDFLDGKRSYKFKIDIYEMIVRKWFEREKYLVSPEKRAKYEEDIQRFSLEVAQHIYKNQSGNELYITSKHIDQFAKTYNILLSGLEVKARSLLTRGEEDKYKFSHKSFLEYFLASHLYNDFEFLAFFDIKRFDAAFDFYLERCTRDHTIPFLKSLCPYDPACLSREQQQHVIDNFGQALLISRNKLEVIIWRENDKRPYSIDWTLLDEVYAIAIRDQQLLVDYKIIAGFRGLVFLTIINCKIENLDFLRFTKITHLHLISCRINPALLSALKNIGSLSTDKISVEID